jgi:multimeric flavodoxin WrbA
MAPSVAFLLGGTRPASNTNLLAREAMRALAETGVRPVAIDITRLEAKHPGCLACYRCQASEAYGCRLDDPVAQAVSSLAEHDAIVLATPMYWYSYPAQVKIFIDRMFSLFKFGDGNTVSSPLKHKPFGLLATAGGPVEGNLQLLADQWRTPAQGLGNPFLACLFPFSPSPAASLAEDAAAMAKAAGFGRDLAGLLGRA